MRTTGYIVLAPCWAILLYVLGSALSWLMQATREAQEAEFGWDE